MTKKELEQLVAELSEQLRQTKEKKPSKIRQCWNWTKPYIIPFILGMIVSTVWHEVPPLFQPSAALEQKAALGGAAIPFPNGNPSPSLSASPPENSTAESTPSLWKNTSEPPSPANPQADNGWTRSVRLFRPLGRPTPYFMPKTYDSLPKD